MMLRNKGKDSEKEISWLNDNIDFMTVYVSLHFMFNFTENKKGKLERTTNIP